MNRPSRKPKHPALIIAIAVATLLGTVGMGAILVLKSAANPVIVRSQAETLDGLVSDWADAPEIPGAILYVQQGDDVIYAGAAGHVRKNGGAPVTIATPFHTASVGKLFTAATVLRLHERGLLDLDAPAADYLGVETLSGLVVVEGTDYADTITIRHLLSHRAGLGNTDQHLPFNLAILMQPNHAWTPQELLDQARTAPPAGRPGVQTRYSSPGYYVLGLVIEAATGRPYHQVVRQEIFAPLGMDATFESNHEWQGEVETLHHYAGWIDLTRHNPSFEFADGGFVTTAQDLARFGIAIARGRVFAESTTTDSLLSPPEGVDPTKQYRALGPRVDHTETGMRMVFHTGSWGVRFIVLPDEDTVAIIALGQTGAKTKPFWDAVRVLLIDQAPRAISANSHVR